MWTITRLRLKRDRRGVSNIIVIVLSLVIIVAIVANIVLWSYEMNQLDWEKMKEDMTITNVERRSSWFVAQGEYTVNIGSRISGTYTDTQAIDDQYESFAEGLNWWNANYSYRRQITIVNMVASTLDVGYSVCVTMETASLVSAGKMLSSGNDLRVVYWSGSSWIELDREVIDINSTSTQVWFKTQATIEASGSNSNYYFYYGNSGAGSPPANRSNVYDFWDDFDDASLDPAWTFSQIGGAAGSYSESGTVVILNATTSGDLWGTSDNFLFLSISRSYDVLVESYTSGWGGSHGTWSKMGGVQLRQSLDPNSKNRIMSPVYSAAGATNSYRLSTGGSTSEQTTGTQPKYNRLSRTGGTSRAWYSTDGISWTELGSQISFSGGLSDPVRLGIHLAGLSSSSHWVEVDWFKVRKYVDPEPPTSLGPEEMWNWWNANYYYRRQITITNNIASALSSGYSVLLTLNTASLVSSGKMLSNGNDLRIVYWNGSSWVEIDRDVIDMNTGSTQVWFKTQAAISASGLDNNYYIYYGNPSAGSPPAYWSGSMGADFSSKVYMAADDFQEHNSGDSPDGWAPCDGYFNVGASGSNRFMNSTANGQYVFAGSSAWTDYIVKVKMQAPTGSVSYPGIAVRVTNVSNLVYFGWRNATTLTLWKRIGGTYTNLGDWTIPNVGTTWHTIEIRVKGQDLYVYNDETYYGSASLSAGELTSGNVGIFSSYGTHAHWDDYTVRKYVSPEPSTSLGPEERQGNNRLDIDGTFVVDVSTYPLNYIQTIEMQLRYMANDTGEKWYLKAYNWSSSTYSDNGFNSTAGHTPTTGWNQYAVNLTDEWRSYVQDDGIIYVRFVDEGADSNQTTIDIDFLGVRAEIDGTRFTFKNEGALTSHLVSLWIINSTNHQRYDINVSVNSAETTTYIRADISLLNGQYTVKVVTERGNTAVYSGS